MRSRPRHGYTIFELLIVIAVIVILGAVVVPNVSSFYGNTRQKAAADLIRSRMVEARAKAREKGNWYRLAISQDKKRIRLAPDTADFDSQSPGDAHAPDAIVTEDNLDQATAELMDTLEPQSGSSTQQTNNTSQNSSSSQWTTIMTVGPEGICKENNVLVSVKEGKFSPILIQLRGVVGSANIATKSGSNP
jgi:prepilin-type N-terminal cleavage/methylation domain-containing protein